MGEDNLNGDQQCQKVKSDLSAKYRAKDSDYTGLVGEALDYKTEKGTLTKKGEKDGYPIRFVLFVYESKAEENPKPDQPSAAGHKSAAGAAQGPTKKWFDGKL